MRSGVRSDGWSEVECAVVGCCAVWWAELCVSISMCAWTQCRRV